VNQKQEDLNMNKKLLKLGALVLCLGAYSTVYSQGENVLGVPSIEVRGQQSGYRSKAEYCLDPAVACGQSGGKVAFQVRYKNDTLPWGVKVELLRGFAGQDWCGGCEPSYHKFYNWYDKKFVEMTAVEPWTWMVQTEAYGYADGAGGQFDALEFVVRVTYPDGTMYWDNGGPSWGYYKVDVPQPLFDLSWIPYQVYDSPFESLRVHTW